MSSKGTEKLKRDSSFEDFEFFECPDDEDVEWPSSPRNEAAEKLTAGVSAVISALSIVAEQQGFSVASPVQAMAATAVGAITGSIVGGPSGLALGLLTGAVIAYRTSPRKPTNSKNSTNQPKRGTIKEIFAQLTTSQKREIVKELLCSLKQKNIKSLIVELIRNDAIKNIAMEIFARYLKCKMGVGLIRR